ncbi:MAG: RNB domain-containing ribonuclease [Nocardioidaceae bacterium]
MRRPHLHVAPSLVPELERRIATIEDDLEVTREFPPDVLAEVDHAVATVTLPERDCTDLPFVTIDPPGAKDLDQAMYIERDGDGYVAHYAISDIGAYVRPGGAIDREAHKRGQTLYAPSYRVPLHPPGLSEDVASLLAGEVRGAIVWRIGLDSTGEGTTVDAYRARVRSRGQYDYAAVQDAVDSDRADEVFLLLREVGQLRQKHERERGGVSLPLPDQEIDVSDGAWTLRLRDNLPVEGWNEQISLLCGMAAAHLMIYAQVGLLRTLPPADPRGVARLRRAARALGIGWPREMGYPDFVRTLDPLVPKDAAMLSECTTLLRGAGYAAFDGSIPAQPEHSAIAAEYAHATAPLRRLADRYVGATCVAICAGEPVPDWVRSGLRELPGVMQATDRLAGRYEREILDLVEAGILGPYVGQVFDGVVIETDDKNPSRGTVLVRHQAIEARITSATALPLGEDVGARLVEADLDTRTVRFELT